MGSVRAARFVRHLPAAGWAPVVITPREGMYHRPGAEWAAPPGIEVVRTASLELSRLFRTAYARGRAVETGGAAVQEPIHAGRIGSAVREWLREFVYLPDAQIGWLPFALKAAAAAAKRHRPEVLYTSSVPFTSHLAGRLLQRRHGMAWVAEFRDLWTGSQAGEARTRVRRALNRRIEADIVAAADAVIVTTPAARDVLARSHPRADPERLHVVTNAFEAAAHPAPTPPPAAGPLVLVHAGTLIPALQDPAPLLAAAAALDRGQPGSVRIRVFGPGEPWSAARARAGVPEHLLDLRGLQSPSRIPAELAQASAVLLLAPGPGFRAVYLGKMFEWLGSGAPALGVVAPDGLMADVLRRSGGGIIAPENDVATLESALARLLREQREGRLPLLAPDPRVREEFEIRNVTARLAGVFAAARERSKRRAGVKS
jgi:glycosyltransferase involved in cell wall biosynthesis